MHIIKKIKTIKNLNKIALVSVIVTLVLAVLYYSVFASDIYPRPIEKNGETYLYFELEHNLTNAKYKYYGYGYTVSVALPGGHIVHSEYLQNSEFNPFMDGSTEKVEIKMRTLMEKIGLATEYFSMSDLTVYLNARMGLKENNVLKFAYDSYDGSKEDGMPYLDKGTVESDNKVVPLNRDSKGIKNGIEYEYGVSWTKTTQDNLRQHFGIPIKLDNPLITWDRYKVEYREVGTEKTVSAEKPYQDYTTNTAVTEYPETVNGYEYSGSYKIDKIDSSNNKTSGSTVKGDSATVDIKKTATRHIITFYYNKVDPSSIGKPVYVDVEYRESTTDGRELKDSTTILGGELSSFNISSAKIDDYECKGYFVRGQSTEYFYNTNASFIIGKENYSKPVNGRLKVIFIYEEKEYISIPKCTPIVDGDANIVNIYIKKKDFENAIDINVNDVLFKLDDVGLGKDKDRKTVEGNHEFRYFDLYIKGYGDSHDNKCKEIMKSLVVPKSKFTQSPTNPNEYTTNIELLFSVFCSCFDGKADKNGNYGMEVDNDILTININIVENKPPVALYDYYTERKFYDGSIQKLKKTYIGQETIIENKANDPNGVKDIKYVKYTLTDSKNIQYYVNLLMLGNGTYFLDDDNVNAKNLIFNGVRADGSLKLKFLTAETWTIRQYVEDIDGLNDIYTNTITPEILDLRPTAVISDTIIYRYPVGMALNGKQNRVVKYSSDSSYVALFLQYDNVKINHNRDCWEIIPLDGQNIDTIYFENKTGLNIIKENNTMQIKYSILNNTKLQFSQTGKYKIRLQVSDTNGNISEWTERIITIHEDLKPKVTANINTKYYRDSNGLARISITNIAPTSLDGDIVVMEDTDTIKYKYDSNNNGSFEDEETKDIKLSKNGSSYETYITSPNLGKYQFLINVKENFGQEYLSEYITNNDYRKAGAILETEIDNIAPEVTLFEIWTTEN